MNKLSIKITAFALAATLALFALANQETDSKKDQESLKVSVDQEKNGVAYYQPFPDDKKENDIFKEDKKRGKDRSIAESTPNALKKNN